MTTIQTKYTPGRLGLGTEFALSEIPLEYSRAFTNRFINLRGNAEKRGGIQRLGNRISGSPDITGLHEYVSDNGTVYLFASAAGNIYRYNSTTSNWDSVLTGKDATQRLISVQMGNKLIFVNGSDRNFYTDDGGNTFKELKAVVETGRTSSTQTGLTSLTDSNITSWTGNTFVTNNDLVYNATLGAYGFVTSVGATNISHTAIGSANGADGLGRGKIITNRNQASGDIYEIIDTVELNIIPTGLTKDNYATLTGSTSAAGVYVSGIDWTSTEIRVGDFMYNTTRNAITRVSAISTACLTVQSVSGQTANDTMTFHKSAMPIATWPHVHYSRLYLIDERDNGTVRISGPDDPQDFTTYQRTLDSTSFSFLNSQPQAERLLTLDTFQQYLVAGGERNVYAFSGMDTVADTSAVTTDIEPAGLFPQGCASRYGLESIGGAMIFAANDGLRNFVANFNANTFQTANISEAIKSELSKAIKSKIDGNDTDDLQCIHYPRRNWLLFMVGDTIYNYNYTPSFNNGQMTISTYGSFSKFTGKFAQQDIYMVRRNGDLICAGAGGYVYEFDKGNYDDDGDTIITVLETGFLTLSEPQQSTQIRTGTYIKPVFETSVPIEYNINVVGGFDERCRDEVNTTTEGVGQVNFGVVGSSPIGGNRVFEKKLPLRWKGQEFKVRIITETTDGPDIITGFTIYGAVLGKV